MKYHDLQVSRQKNTNRKGRGISAGQGKTAGRGTKGQNSRAGGRRRPGFEGGQTPLMQRLPKLSGFRSLHDKADNIYTDQLNGFANKTVDNFVLTEAKLVLNPYTKVKVLLRGELTSKVDVHLQGASKTAQEVIKKAGGSFVKTAVVARAKQDKNIK